jgi:histidine ammonia-lyase
LADPVVIGDRPLTWGDYELVVYEGVTVEISAKSRAAEHRAVLEDLIAEGQVIYSVNTGYGAEASKRVAPEAINRMQLNTLRSHAVGIGDPVPETIARGQMLLKAQAYAQGPAGLRPDVTQVLVDALNAGAFPVIPELGSQSASGDLIPNAHLGLALTGEGEVIADGVRRPAAAAGLSSIQPAMKEGVALTNDCSFAAALAIDAVRSTGRLIEHAEQTAAMTLQALRGYPEAFDTRLVERRPHRGALETAAHLRELVSGSELLRAATRPHDPYSLRCVPQVHGAIRDAVAYARAALDVELNAIGDNPVVLADDGVALSGGNIHGEAIAIPMDTVTIAIVELATLSQRRTHHLLSGALDANLPPKLSPSHEDSFGLLLLNTAAAALVSESKTLAVPASIESIGVDHMEDHVSMAALAARKAGVVLGLARTVIAIELACAAQAIDFTGVDRASMPTKRLHQAVRQLVPFAEADAPLDVTPLRELW